MQRRSCPTTAGRVRIDTHAAIEQEPHDFDLSAHAGEHQTLLGCYGGDRQREKTPGQTAPLWCSCHQPCLQPIRSSGSSGKGRIVRARPARSVRARSPACQNKAPFRAVNRRRRVRRLRHRPNTIALPTCRRHPLRSGGRTIRAGPSWSASNLHMHRTARRVRASRYQQSRNLVRVRNGELQLRTRCRSPTRSGAALRDEANRPRTDEPGSDGQLPAQRTGIAGDDRSDSASKRGSLGRENLVNTAHSCSSVETVRDWVSGQICTPGPLMLAGTQPRRNVKSYRVAILAARM
jgi:hypothetical protein